ncbi:amidohydrolase [Pseudomonas sp. BN515]|uniref:amidohydrolase family protein n=1 Tax=Pseudomonas sp. BN515 TaxID=2567892 RepID=UPI002453EDBB|nr:amidohydrolase [Pseudomonas sp. BN515]MDH4874204.1 amidohydrolase [Pseudomonas sp. BN515]
MNRELLWADHVLTMDADNRVINDGAVLVEGSRIAAVGPARNLLQQYPQVKVRRLTDRLLMPGLVNTHCHSGMLRGTAEGLPVWDWLQQFIDPMHRVLTPQEARLSSWLCYAEALLSGTTTVVDMWRYMDGSAEAASELGIRAVLVPYVAEHPDHDYFETLASNEALIRKWHQAANGRISVWVGLEHLFYAVPEAWKRIGEMCRTHDVGFHTHSNESRFDVEETLRRHGIRPVQALEKFGLLDARKVLLAHCVWVDDEEIALLARRNVGVAHNPVSNMKLASGAAPIEKMLAAGVSVGLGTDGEKENNNLDMFEEMKVSSLLAKFAGLDAAALDAWSVCRMATIGGARALGLDQQIGSLEVGKAADLIAVRVDTPRMTPLLASGPLANMHHNLVHAAQGGDVDLTMVSGRVLVENGQLRTADLDFLITEVNQAVPQLFARRQAWLDQAGVAINELTRTADA